MTLYKKILLSLFIFIGIPLTASAYAFQGPLTTGSQGDDVSALQQILKDKGFYTYPEITGYFGAMTLEAVQAFQRSEGIATGGTPETTGYGLVGPRTIAALNAGTPAAPTVSTGFAPVYVRDLDIGANGEDVRQLQRFLNENGYPVAQAGAGSAGQETTYFGPATQAALARWQAAQGISPAVGHFGPATRAMVVSQSNPTLTPPSTSDETESDETEDNEEEDEETSSDDSRGNTDGRTRGMVGTSGTITYDTPQPPQDAPPVISGGQPSGVLATGTASTSISVVTDEAATCRYATSTGASFGSMIGFTVTGTTTHSTRVTGLSDGNSYSYYVKCQDGLGNTDASDYVISFSVASTPVVVAPPVISAAAALGSTTINVAITLPGQGEDELFIYRSTTQGQGSSGTLIYSGVPKTAHADTGRSSDTTYYYTAYLENASNTRSVASNEVSAALLTALRSYSFDNSASRLQDVGSDAVTAAASGTVSYAGGRVVLPTGAYLDLGVVKDLRSLLYYETFAIEFDIVTSTSTTLRIFGTENSPDNTGDLIYGYANLSRLSNGTLQPNMQGHLYTLVRINGVEIYASIAGNTGIADGNPHKLRYEYNLQANQIHLYVDGAEVTAGRVMVGSVANVSIDPLTRNFYFGALNDVSGVNGYLNGQADNVSLGRVKQPGGSLSGRLYKYATTTKITTLNDSASNAFPMSGVWRKADAYYGRIVTCYRTGPSHAGFVGTTSCVWSDNNGATWSSPVSVLSNAAKDYREGGMQERPNGGLILGTGWRASNQSASGTAELYDISWDGSGQIVLSSLGILSDPARERTKHVTSVIELAPNNWLAAADSLDMDNTDWNAQVWKSTDQGLTWSIYRTPAAQAAMGGDRQGEAALVPDPVIANKLWFYARQEDSRLIRRWYSNDNGDTWTLDPLVVDASGSPRSRVIDGKIMGAWRDRETGFTRVFVSENGTTLRSIGLLDTTVSNLVLNDMMTYAQIVQAVNGDIILISGSQASDTNSDILVTKIVAN